MPTVIYKCSKCGMVRASYCEAERCEASHLSAVLIRNIEYKSGAYPFRIALVFPDGKERAYQIIDLWS